VVSDELVVRVRPEAQLRRLGTSLGDVAVTQLGRAAAPGPIVETNRLPGLGRQIGARVEVFPDRPGRDQRGLGLGGLRQNERSEDEEGESRKEATGFHEWNRPISVATA